MSQKIFLSLVYLLFCGIAHSQPDIPQAENLSTLGLSGKVKSVLEVSYNAKKGNAGITKTTKGWQYDYEHDAEYFFDTLGNLVLENKLLPSQKETVYTILYDSLKRISEVNRSHFSHRFVYDSLNRISSSVKENKKAGANENALTNYLYHYNSQNLLIKIEEFGENSGVLIETFQYGPSGNLIYRELGKSGDLTEIHQYKYNEDLLLIKEEWKNSRDGMLETTSYIYKDKKKILEHWVDYELGKSDGFIDDTYENGNVIKTVEKDADGVIVMLETCTYQFDNHGNWIKKTITSDEKYFIVERSIAYFE